MSEAREATARLWTTYAHHARVGFAHGPAPTFQLEDRWFLATSGADHVDMNQAGLFVGASTADADALADAVEAADVPVLFGCPSDATPAFGPALERVGFTPAPLLEHLFRMPGVPTSPALPPGATAFEVRRVESAEDAAAMEAMFADVHGYPPSLVRALYVEAFRAGDAVSGWLAWEGEEAVSFTIVTMVNGSLSLREVMTPVRHRRRGAARAVITAALDAVARSSSGSIAETLFWSSPAGMPLYGALGFSVADTVRIWTRGASEADLAATGVI